MLYLTTKDLTGFRFVFPTEKEIMMTADWEIARVTFTDLKVHAGLNKGNTTVCCDMKQKLYRGISEIEYHTDKEKEMSDWHYNFILKAYNNSHPLFRNRPVYIGED